MEDNSPDPASPTVPAYVAPPRPAGTLTRAQLVAAVGDGAFSVTFVGYLSHAAHLTPAWIGAVLTVAWGTGFLLTHPIGALGDRFGLRRLTILLALATAAALMTLAAAPGAGVVAVACTAYAITQSGAGATRQALLVRLVPPVELVAVRARIQTAANVGIGIGAAAGGLALLSGSDPAYRLVLLGDAALFAGNALLLSRLPAAAHHRRPGRAWDALRDTPYLAAAALNAVMYLYMPLLSVLLPLYLAARTAAPRWLVAGVFVVNTVGVVAGQRRAARRVATFDDATRAIRRAGVLLGAACLVFWGASRVTGPVAAAGIVLAGAALQVAGEIRLAAGSWTVGFALADPARPGQWQGVYASGIPLARAVGPAALTGLVMVWTGPGWLLLGLVFLAAGLAATLVVTWAGNHRPFPLDTRKEETGELRAAPA
ncbi:MFS transporter [Planosporangium sp. 12N6]|uniref:MFS transporter n=1 Tax=Planosporangium spinosum TaxID=3402278 RepID=UPI003CE992E7